VTTFYFCEDCGTQFINFEDVNQKPVECEECQHTEFMEFYSKSAADKKFALAIETLSLIKDKSPRCDCMDAPGIATETLKKLEKNT
jgi:DNA-directed RNA polymerase subunit RPC12/RpoP